MLGPLSAVPGTSASRSVRARLARAVSLLTALAVATLGAVVVAPAAQADGALNFTASVDAPGEALQGAELALTLTAQNPTATPAYNTSFRLVLPAGVSWSSSTPAPTSSTAGPAAGETTLVWMNVSDLLAGSPGPLVSLPVTLQVASTVPLGPLALSGQAYASTNPRLLPTFTAAGVASGAHTAYQAISDTVQLVPFLLTKTLLTAENELLRGVHDQRAEYQLRIDNNFVDTSTDFQIVDYIPAALEFLGCGEPGADGDPDVDGDNTAVGVEEYPGSGRLNATSFGLAAGTCPEPTTVVTQTLDPDGASGPLPAGVYTVVTWDTAALATATATDLSGTGSLDAGESAVISYVVGIPQRANADTFAGSVGLAGQQASNLDNNTGASTIELDGAEQSVTNLAVLGGDYDDPNAAGGTQSYSDDDAEVTVLEDVSIHKGVDAGTIVQGGTSLWTLLVETSEYTTSATEIVVVDTLPDGLRVTGTSPAATSVVEQNDGSTLITWSGAATADMVTNDTATYTVSTVARAYYRQGLADDLANPVRANDAWTNSVDLSARAVDLDLTDRMVQDESSAGQSADPISLDKTVAAPDASGLCGDGSGLTWEEPVSTGTFTPGDYVCWKIDIVAPPGLDTTNSSLSDFLPPGFTYTSSTTGLGSAITFPAPVVDGSVITWTFSGATGNLDESRTASVVLRSQVTDPRAAADGDILGNLAKLAYENTDGTLFQLRDRVDARWAEPELTVAKSVSPTGPVTGGQTVTYRIDVVNGGSRDAESVVVRDILPSQLACTDITSGYTLTGGTESTALACAGGVIDGTLTAVPASSTVSIAFDVLIPNTVIPGTTLTNRAGVRTYTADTNSGGTFTYVPSGNIDGTPSGSTNTDPATGTVNLPITGAVVTKAVATDIVTTPGSNDNTASEATIGEWATYTVTATLPKDATVTGTRLVDTVSGRLFLATSGVGVPTATSSAGTALTTTVAANTITVAVADHTVGATDETITLTFRARVLNQVGSNAGTQIDNVATLSWDNGSGGTISATSPNAPITLVEPSMDLAKTGTDDGDGMAEPGEVLSYSLTVRNLAGTRTSTAFDTVVVDQVPSSMVPTVDGTTALADGGTVPGGGVWNSGASTLTWPAFDLVGGASQVFAYQVLVRSPLPVPASYQNSATVTTSSLPGDLPAEERSATTTPTRTRYTDTDTHTFTGPLPSVVKTVSPATAAPGQVVTYTLAATVPSDITTHDLTVRDSLPAGLVLVPGSTTVVGCAPACGLTVGAPITSGQQVAWYVGDISAVTGDRVLTFTYQAYVDGATSVAAASTLDNAARLRFSGTPGPAPTTIAEADALPAASATSTARVTVTEPSVALTKTVGSAAGQTHARRVLPGETVTYTITLRNTGTSTAYDVAVADTTDPRFAPITAVTGATVTDADPSGDGSLAFTVADIPVNGTSTITYQALVPDPLTANPTGPELSNTAVSTYTSAAGTPAGDRSYTTNTDTVGLEGDVASIGDTVWFDTNANGVQDLGELGVQGVTVTVTYLGPDNTLGTPDDEVHPTTTGATGAYLVEDLPQGLYRVEISGVPAGTVNTYDEDSTTTAPDGVTAVTLADGDAHRTADFGIRGSGTVGDTVWLDQNGDGAQGTGEPGLGGVEVTVSWPAVNGQPAGTITTTTAADGTWSVTGIPAADVTVSLAPASYPAGTTLVSEPHGGAVDGTATFPLAAGATDDGFDFGLRGTGEIGDRLWVDTNRDGVQDPTEPGIPGATVEVRWLGPDLTAGTTDDLLVTTTTGADGAYLVGGLPAGEYTVTVTALPTALAPTFDEDSALVSPDGTTRLTLPAGGSHRTADFGYVADTGVGDRVWLDLNGDGVQDLGEPGIPGVEVTVTSAGIDGLLGTSDDIVRTTTTGVDGAWLVTGLPAGLTQVAVTGGLPGGVTESFDADGVLTPGVSEVTLVDGSVVTTQDFGYTGPNSIGDLVWVDVNADGVQDAGEPGLPGVTVELTWLGPDGVVGGGDDMVVRAITGPDGAYLAAGLPDGDWTVAVIAGIPAGYAPSYDETDVADGASTVVGLGAGGPEDHLTADFGYAGTGAIGGTVWLDRLVDGTLDTPTEAGLPGVAIDVTWSGPDGILGTPDDVEIRTLTGEGGTWTVEHMPPGPFTAVVDTTTIPAGTTVVWDRTNGTSGPSGAYGDTLDPGEIRTDIDTAVRGTGSIGDLVWIDSNRNGTRDPNEPAATNVRVVVTWLGGDGVLGGGDDVSVEVRTDGDGIYVADGLPAGRFVVTFDKATFPKGTAAYADLDGGDPLVTTVDLAAGQQRTDVDLVLRPTFLASTGATVGGIVLLALLLIGGGVFLRRRAARIE